MHHGSFSTAVQNKVSLNAKLANTIENYEPKGVLVNITSFASPNFSDKEYKYESKYEKTVTLVVCLLCLRYSLFS